MSDARNFAVERGQQYADQMYEMADRSRRNVEHVLEDYPLSTTLGVFGVGLCLGVAIGAGLSHSSSQSARAQQVAESLGRRMFDAVHDYLPKAVDQYLRS